MPKPAAVRFYVDADLLGLAHILAETRSDVTYPGDLGGLTRDKRVRPPCPVTRPATPDDEWIPAVASAGWLIITRDGRIQNRLKELRAVSDSSARMVALNTGEATTVWNQLQIVARQWERIESLLDVPGPVIYRASKSTLSKLDVV